MAVESYIYNRNPGFSDFQIFLRILYITDEGKRTNVSYKYMNERKKRKTKFRKEDRKENLEKIGRSKMSAIIDECTDCHILHSY